MTESGQQAFQSKRAAMAALVATSLISFFLGCLFGISFS